MRPGFDSRQGNHVMKSVMKHVIHSMWWGVWWHGSQWWTALLCIGHFTFGLYGAMISSVRTVHVSSWQRRIPTRPPCNGGFATEALLLVHSVLPTLLLLEIESHLLHDPVVLSFRGQSSICIQACCPKDEEDENRGHSFYYKQLVKPWSAIP